MIFDHISNYKLYATNPTLEKAFAFINDYLTDPKPDGRYDIDGDKLYANVSSFESKPEGALEAHDHYIDLQFLVRGQEKIEYAYREGLTVKTPYTYDVVFYEDSPNNSTLLLTDGFFCLLYPMDAHKPSQAVTEPAPITKIVVKIKID